MHEDEFLTDVPLVKRLLQAQFPHWADLPLTRVASAGTDNALYRLGDEMVVRLPRIYWAIGNIEKEYYWQPRLAPYLPVAIPTPLGLGEPGEGYPWNWAIYSWLDGENTNYDRVANPQLLAKGMVEFITAFRRIDLASGPPSGKTLTGMDASVRSAIEALRKLELTDTAAVTEVWDAALKLPAWDGPPGWLHGDLAPGNLLLTAGKLSGVIDFSGVGVGDPINDLGVAWNLLPAEVRDDFREGLKVDEITWLRGRGRALGQALVQLPYYYITNQELAAQARHVIGEVLDDYRRVG